MKHQAIYCQQSGTFCQLDPYMTTLTIAGVWVFHANAYENLKHLTPDIESNFFWGRWD